MTASAGGFLLLTVYLQGMLGYSPLTTGLAFLPPAAIFFFVGGWGASRLVNRLGMKKVRMISAGLGTLGSLLPAPICLAAGCFGSLPRRELAAPRASNRGPELALAGRADA